MSSHSCDAIVVGGGFFGCFVAEHLRRSGARRTVLLEMKSELLQRASLGNQARVHNGYHYPRSFLTAYRCRVSFARFVKEFERCIVRDFRKYYAISHIFSKVTASQYRQFCARIGAPLREAPKEVRVLFDPTFIEFVFEVEEYAFDAVKLKEVMLERLEEASIDVRVETEAERVARLPGGRLELRYRSPEGAGVLVADRVFNCTYSRLNWLAAASNLPRVRLKHELTEIALVEVPGVIRDSGITVMCGPFFSIMPFPSKALHTLSHVRHTPHFEWHDEGHDYVDPYDRVASTPVRTHYPHMIRDAARYVPCLSECRYSGESIWGVKTILPRSEIDDSRPVLLRRNQGVNGFTSLMGGKIDNVYDIVELMDLLEESVDGDV